MNTSQLQSPRVAHAPDATHGQRGGSATHGRGGRLDTPAAPSISAALPGGVDSTVRVLRGGAYGDACGSRGRSGAPALAKISRPVPET